MRSLFGDSKVQDPQLFSGTLRENLDPWHQASDSEVWDALEAVQFAKFTNVRENHATS